MFDWFGSGEIAILVGFHVFIVGMLALDLGIFHRQAHAVSLKEAAIWSSVWVALAGVFAWAIWNYWDWWEPDQAEKGPEKALEFFTGYLVEKSLSLDNLFVFLVIFRYFGVPAHLQHRVLIWGLLGALVFRATLILLGAALLSVFHILLYVFGAFLIYTAYRLFHAVEDQIDPGRNPVLRLALRFVRIVDNYDAARFWVRRQGRWHATPLLLVLLVVETTDVVFALDSIPAIFGITQDTFIVYTSNIFAILGLRALYFLLAGFLGMFRYLNVGLALVLGFVGIKMVLEPLLNPSLESWGIQKREQILISLGVITVVLTGAIVASIVKGKKAFKESAESL
jgi:tellurite resistance protein TerC